jgi:hypothetical protein
MESKKKPKPDDILKAIREKLLPLGFDETHDAQFHDSSFRRNSLSVGWNNHPKNEYFSFSISEQGREIVAMNSPWYITINEKDWTEFGGKVLESLDDWLKTI